MGDRVRYVRCWVSDNENDTFAVISTLTINRSYFILAINKKDKRIQLLGDDGKEFFYDYQFFNVINSVVNSEKNTTFKNPMLITKRFLKQILG